MRGRSVSDLNSVSLSSDTISRINAGFREVDRREVIWLLVERRGNNLPFCENSDAVSLERTRFAALKLSDGNPEALRDAVRLANTDWRDLLVAAAFANESWFPNGHTA